MGVQCPLSSWRHELHARVARHDAPVQGRPPRTLFFFTQVYWYRPPKVSWLLFRWFWTHSHVGIYYESELVSYLTSHIDFSSRWPFLQTAQCLCWCRKRESANLRSGAARRSPSLEKIYGKSHSSGIPLDCWYLTVIWLWSGDLYITMSMAKLLRSIQEIVIPRNH